MGSHCFLKALGNNLRYCLVSLVLVDTDHIIMTREKYYTRCSNKIQPDLFTSQNFEICNEKFGARFLCLAESIQLPLRDDVLQFCKETHLIVKYPVGQSIIV